MRRVPPTFFFGLTALVFAVALPDGSMLETPEPPGPLSADAAGVALPADIQSDPAILRSRYVGIDFAALPASPQRRMRPRDRDVRLELFPDVVITASFDRFDGNPGGVTWVGRVDGVAMSSVTLVYSGGLLAGSIIMPGAAYEIRPAPADARANSQPGRELHIVSQIDQDALPREAPPIEVRFDSSDLAAASGAPMADSAEFIDLMVVFTQAAMTHAGGATGIANLINLGISETNTSYANSGVTHRVRLVHASQVPYTESSAFGTNLTNLRIGSGELAGVPALRDANRADLVMMLVHPTSPDFCGIAYLMTSVNIAFAPLGFSIVDTQCVMNSTMAHELGHNMGARHDWFVDTGTTPFSYAHGYVNPAFGQRWRTIMSYPDLCGAQGFSCTRLLAWANPDTTFNPFCAGRGFTCRPQLWYLPGLPMGIPGGTSTACQAGNAANTNCDADDRRTLNNTALTVANLRQQ